MIERFNFYDVYAYLVPGATLLGFLAIPLGLTQWMPPSGFWSALSLLGVSYILGLLVHEAAAATPLLNIKPLPSATMLEKGDRRLSTAFKTRLSEEIKARYGIDVSGQGEEDESRREAFRLARAHVAAAQRAGYAEQFQGMYAMMRGLAAVCWLSIPWHAGWLVWRVYDVFSAGVHAPTPRLVTYLLLVTSLLVVLYLYFSLEKSREQRAAQPNYASRWKGRLQKAWPLGWPLLAFHTGATVAAFTQSQIPVGVLLLPMAIGGIASLVFSRSFFRFAERYAEEVYVQFLSSVTKVEQSPRQK